jgi:hypothetical protein
MNIIKEYQSLLGSSLGVAGSVFVIWFTLFLTKKKEIEGSKKEIEKIFLMASREFASSVADLELYLTNVCDSLKKTENVMDISLTPKFNFISINEERLFSISKNLDHIFSQQIDIATSAAKRFNGYLEHYEVMPKMLFDYNVKCLEAGLMAKEEVAKDYKESRKNYLESIKNCLNKDVPILRRHLLRPIMVQDYTNKEIFKMVLSGVDLDKKLDENAEIILVSNNYFQ